MFRNFVFILLLTNSRSLFCPIVDEEDISETNLKTGPFCMVTTQNTTNQFMTWSYSSHPKLGHRYVVSDKSYINRYRYQKRGQNYLHAQWFFLPAKGHLGWYHLANRGLPREFAFWSYKDGEVYTSGAYYLILDPTYEYSTENPPKLEYLFKPVKQGQHYQLRLRALSNAIVNTARQQEFENSSRFYVYANNLEKAAALFQKSGLWFYSALFNLNLLKMKSQRAKAALNLYL